MRPIHSLPNACRALSHPHNKEDRSYFVHTTDREAESLGDLSLVVVPVALGVLGAVGVVPTELLPLGGLDLAVVPPGVAHVLKGKIKRWHEK